MGLNPREDFYEHELKRIVNKYGTIAQVWSASEIRTDPEHSSDVRGLISIQLHFENFRWYINNWTAQMKSEQNTLVKEFLKDH